MADALFSDEDMGITPAASPASAPAVPATPTPSPVAATGDAPPPVTIRPQAAPALLSDEDMGIGAAPSPASSGVLSNSSDDGWLSGLAKGTATGAIRGVANTVGTVGNLSNLADFLVAGGEHLVTGQPVADIMSGIKSQRTGQEQASGIARFDPRTTLPSGEDVAAPILAKTGDYQPTSMLGRAGQAGVEALAGSVGPGVGSAVAGTPLKTIAEGAADMAIPNFASGAAAQTTSDETGNPYAGMAAGLLAPIAVDTAARYGKRLPSGLGGDYFENVDDARIGRKLLGLAENPAAVQETLNPTDLTSSPSSIAVPGFKPTTGQLTGDLGLLRAENLMKTADNTAFAARSGEQNSAVQASLASVASGADELRPSAVLQDHLAAIDQATQQAVDRLTRGAQTLAAPLGEGQTAEQAGATIREKVKATQQQAQQLRSDLYRAVDPDGTLATTASPIRDQVAAIRKNLDAYAEPLSPDEQRLFGLASQMPPVLPYRSLVAFDANLNSALPNATRGSRARLQQLKTVVMATLDGTADRQAQAEAQQVAAGTRAPGDTVATRMQQAMPLASGTPAAGSSVFTPSGRQIGVKYGVMDAGDLTASHRPDLTANPDYPANLQPRDRTRAASEAQVTDIAANLQPERLGASASAAEGAPIVGPDGIVESGNGRVLAIQRAHAQGGPRAQAYRDFLASHGFDHAGMKAPVLVRQRMTDLSPEDRVRFAQEANASPVLTQSATERAATDAGRLSDNALVHYQGGDITSAANRPFVRSFLGDVSDKGEAGGFAAPDGSLSMDGARRVRNALLHAGYGDSGLVTALAETGDPDIAAFGGVLGDQAGRMAQLRRGIAGGDVHPGADVSAPVLEAARVVQRARAGNMRLADAVAQEDAFNPISDAAHTVLKAAYGPTLTSRLARNRMGAYLDDAVREATQQTAGDRLFGEPLTARQILEGAQARHVERQATGTDPTDSVTHGGLLAGAGPGAPGEAGGRPGPSPRGEGGTGPGASGGDLTRGALAPSLDPEAPARLRAAKDSHIDYQKRFVDGPVARAIADNGHAGQYDALSSAVPAMAIRKGDQGYEVARAFLRDSGNDPAVIEALTDRALAPLRTSLTSQSTVSPAAYAKWRQDFGPALRALDEAAPGFAHQYANASAATDLMLRAGAMREQALDAFNKSAAAKFIGVSDASEVQARVGSIIDSKSSGVTDMSALVSRLHGATAAMDGLRRAGAAYIAQKFSNATKEAATSEQTLSATKLPKFVDERAPVLRKLFSEDEFNRIRAVAHVLDQKQLSTSGTAIKGTSNTPRDLFAALKHSGASAAHGGAVATVLALGLERVGEHVMGGSLGELLSPETLLAGAGAGVVYKLHKRRAANAKADQTAIADALMNPERFAHYTARVNLDGYSRRTEALAASLRRQLINQPMIQRTAEKAPGYKRGGAIGGQRGGISVEAAERAAEGLMRLAEQFKVQNSRVTQMAALG